jgi:transcriptional regulator GlxA family with amidase domain
MYVIADIGPDTDDVGVAPRSVVFVAFDGVQALDLVGPLEVFAAATEVLAATGDHGPGYTTRVVSGDGAPVRSTSGLAMSVDGALTAERGTIDTLVITGGRGVHEAAKDRRIVDSVIKASGRSRRTTSVCTGAFLLAATGLLDGKRVTTHWASCGELAARYPAVDVHADPIYIHDGDVWTSAGVTAGMDLALALVEADLGRKVALTVARWLVLFVKRPGSQAQFSAQLANQVADREPLRDLQHWIADNPGSDLSVSALAGRVSMSPRHLARTFRRSTGQTPARFVERVRLETARRRLEESGDAVEAIAAACGFGTAETMRRTFVRVLGTAPSEYRKRFKQTT